MKFNKVFALVFSISVFFAVFAGARNIEITPENQTDECYFAQGICSFAMELQAEFDAMPQTTDDERSQRREIMQVLNSSIAQCERARRECTRSMRRQR